MSKGTEPFVRIGLLNMMADGALRATERQFQRLLTPARFPGKVDLVLFSLAELQRSPEAAEYIQENYQTFDQVAREGLDGLIITGVNLSDPQLAGQPFWVPLMRVMAWAEQNVHSTLCSCLATHAVLQFRFGEQRCPLPQKLWGVFPQTVVTAGHPLTRGIPSTWAVPHSRHNDVSFDQFLRAGLEVLVGDDKAGVHLASSTDLHLVTMQGHPEYDTISLLKEYKREVGFFQSGHREDYPPLPDNYVDEQGRALLHEYRLEVEAARVSGMRCRSFPESEVIPHLVNDWADPTLILFANWLELVSGLISG